MDLQDNKTPSTLYPDDLYTNLNGLGGWMVIVIIGRILTIIMTIKDMAAWPFYRILFGNFYAIIIVYDVVVGLGLSVAILYFIFQRKIIFRRLFVIQIAITLVIATATFVLTLILLSPEDNGTDMAQLIINILSGVVWIIYLYRSARVKNTFIYAHQYPEAYNDQIEIEK